VNVTIKNQSCTLLILLSVYLCILLLFGLWPMNFCEDNHAAVNHSDGLILSHPSTVYSKEPPEKLLNLQEFTICIDMSSDFAPSKGFGTILSYALDYERVNFLVGQWRSGIELRIASDDHARPISIGRREVFTKGTDSWFAISYDGAAMSLYQDGEKIASRRIGPITFSSWNKSYPLIIGSDASGRSSWKGAIRSVAIFDRALREDEFIDIPGRLQELSPLVCYDYTNMDDTTIIDCGTPPPAHLTIPHRLIPYQRAFLELPSMKDVRFPWGILDITINLIGFVPLGFLISLYIGRESSSHTRSILISIAAGFMVSFIIEISQAYLSSRSSSMLDLINNTVGSGLGALLYHFRKGVLHRRLSGYRHLDVF